MANGAEPATLVARYLDLAEEELEGSPIPTQLVERVQAKHITILGIAKLLGSSLTDPQDDKRARGIALISHVLENLPAASINRQETRHLTDFLTSASSLTSACLVEACHGLMALAKLPTFGQGDAVQVAKALFAHIDMRAHHQGTRFFVYSLIDTLLSHHRQGLKSMGVEFLKGYASLIEGEKDPRNLKLGFAMDQVILIEFDVEGAVEDLFDISFCYFPITFTPPPDDPYGISSEELQEALRNVLSAHPDFGPLALPLILDKLSAPSKSAKHQSLQLIIKGFPVYGHEAVLEYSKLFWEALSVEVFRSTDAQLEETAVQAMRVFLRTLYPDPTTEDVDMDSPQPEIKGVAEELVKNCTEEMKEAEKANAKSAARILSAAVSSSSRLANFVLESILPHFLVLLKSQDQASIRPSIIDHLGSVIRAARDCDSSIAGAFQPVKDELVSLLVSAAKVPATRSQAFSCLTEIFHFRFLLSTDERAFIISTFNTELTSSDPEASEPALQGLVNISAEGTKEIASTTLPLLLAQLPSDPSSNSDETYKSALNSLARICVPAELFDVLVVRLVSRLETCAWEPRNALYLHHLLITLHAILKTQAGEAPHAVAKGAERLVQRLFALFVRQDAPSDVRLAEDAARSVLLLSKHLIESEQIKVAAAIEKSFWEGNVATLTGKTSTRAFDPFNAGTPHSVLALYSAFFIPVLPAVLQSIDLGRLSATLLRQTVITSPGPIRGAACHLLASLANKSGSAILVDVDEYWQNFVVTGTSIENRRRALIAVAWLARGLVVRSDPAGYEYADRLLDLCTDAEIGQDAARAVEIIGQEEEWLTKQNHAIVKLLYKQKFSSSMLNKIVQKHESAAGPAKSNYIMALAALSRHMPKQLCISEMPKHFSLFLKALSLPIPDLRRNILDTFAVLIRDAPKSVESHASLLIGSLLDLAQPSTTAESTAEERVAAIRCLAAFAQSKSVDFLSIGSQKPVVLRRLALCLDDKRRVVRKEAVDCRSAWYRLEA